MAGNTTIPSGSVVTSTVKIDGKPIDDTTLVYSIEIMQSVNRISSAEIILLDGDVTKGKFDQSSSSTFVPGKKVIIEVGYESKNEKIFEGIITKQGLKINKEGATLIVECKDEAVKMTVGRKSKTFKEKTDSDIISSIIGEYSGLKKSVASTTTAWPEQVQYYTSDWDFVLARAQANGFVTTTLDGKLTVEKYDADSQSVLEVKYGDNLIDFNSELDSVSQIANVKASTWDYKTQKVITGEAPSQYAGAGNLSSKKLSEVVGLKNFELQTPGYLKKDDLTNWSKAQILKNEYAKIKGRVKVQGTKLVLPAKFITLSGLGDRFNGDNFVSEVRHFIGDGDWMTHITIGMSPYWFTENTDVMSPPAAGLLPGARGLFNATVKKMYEDPDNQYRILIDIPLFDGAGEGLWARLSNFYSTSGAGAFFLPEVGDEVVIGFLNQDPRYPIILGSLYSSTKNKPFEGLAPNEKNTKKAIVSKSHIQIEFDDENKILTIKTPSENTIVLNDKDKEISIKDQNSNSIVMSGSGITIKSPKNINIEAGQKVNIKGSSGVTIESSGGDVTTKGLNVKTTASMEYNMSASTQASLKSGMQMSLKSGMIMIN